jgi:methionine-rich copper-binding protein CopC
MKHKLWLAVLALVLAFSQPALAHDELVGQSPADGEQVAAGVIDIRLEFSQSPLALEDGSGNEIVITGPSGEAIYSGCLPTEQNFGVLSADLDQPGSHTVTWRVVSSDGHPISGEFKFEVENSSGYVSDPNFAYPECVGNLISPAEQPADFYWILWLALGVIAAGIFIFLRPKKRT